MDNFLRDKFMLSDYHNHSSGLSSRLVVLPSVIVAKLFHDQHKCSLHIQRDLNCRYTISKKLTNNAFTAFQIISLLGTQHNIQSAVDYLVEIGMKINKTIPNLVVQQLEAGREDTRSVIMTMNDMSQETIRYFGKGGNNSLAVLIGHMTNTYVSITNIGDSSNLLVLQLIGQEQEQLQFAQFVILSMENIVDKLRVKRLKDNDNSSSSNVDCSVTTKAVGSTSSDYASCSVTAIIGSTNIHPLQKNILTIDKITEESLNPCNNIQETRSDISLTEATAQNIPQYDSLDEIAVKDTNVTSDTNDTEINTGESEDLILGNKMIIPAQEKDVNLNKDPNLDSDSSDIVDPGTEHLEQVEPMNVGDIVDVEDDSIDTDQEKQATNPNISPQKKVLKRNFTKSTRTGLRRKVVKETIPKSKRPRIVNSKSEANTTYQEKGYAVEQIKSFGFFVGEGSDRPDDPWHVSWVGYEDDPSYMWQPSNNLGGCLSLVADYIRKICHDETLQTNHESKVFFKAEVEKVIEASLKVSNLTVKEKNERNTEIRIIRKLLANLMKGKQEKASIVVHNDVLEQSSSSKPHDNIAMSSISESNSFMIFSKVYFTLEESFSDFAVNFKQVMKCESTIFQNISNMQAAILKMNEGKFLIMFIHDGGSKRAKEACEWMCNPQITSLIKEETHVCIGFDVTIDENKQLLTDALNKVTGGSMHDLKPFPQENFPILFLMKQPGEGERGNSTLICSMKSLEGMMDAINKPL